MSSSYRHTAILGGGERSGCGFGRHAGRTLSFSLTYRTWFVPSLQWTSVTWGQIQPPAVGEDILLIVKSSVQQEASFSFAYGQVPLYSIYHSKLNPYKFSVTPTVYTVKYAKIQYTVIYLSHYSKPEPYCRIHGEHYAAERNFGYVLCTRICRDNAWRGGGAYQFGRQIQLNVSNDYLSNFYCAAIKIRNHQMKN